MASDSSKYSFIGNNESKESDSDSESVGLLLQEVAFRRHRRRALWPWIAHVIFFTSSLTLFVMGSIRFYRSSTSEVSIEPLWTREYGPAVEAVGQKHGWQLLGAFDQPSPWRGQPNEEVDKAWDDITHSGVFSVTEEDIERIGKLENSTVMLPPESGGGYMASLEAVHQLHCLNMLREFSFREYYADKAEPFSDPFKLRTHIDHCTEMLRQTIMCNADMHLITYNWVAHVDYAWPNFSLNRQCRSWDNMQDWIAARTAHTTAEHGLIRRPPGAAVMDVNPVEYVHVGF
ncbi:hypothetical protein HD806DRAFT_546089 [Xylariaceae sp. AK1471]|nr:hypothetical protein HD806DRAFT_546089 [Xylariaceae sp. AK1471]